MAGFFVSAIIANLDATLAAADVSKIKLCKKYFGAYLLKILQNQSSLHERCKNRGNDIVHVFPAA